MIFALAVLGSAVSIFTVDGWLAGELMDGSPDFRRGEFMRGARAIGSGHAALWFLCLLAWVRKRPRVLAIGILALLICALGVVALKHTTRRGRPDRDSTLRPVPSVVVRSSSDLSFPSGDTAQAFSLAFVAAAYMPKPWGFIPLGIAVLPGVQRVLGGRHFLSDALAGLALGVLSASLALGFDRRFRYRIVYLGRLRRSSLLASFVLLGWGAGWFLEEGQAFASIYVPLVAIAIFCIKGPALARWTTGVALGPLRAGDTQKERLRAMRLLTAAWMAMILMPPILANVPVDQSGAGWMHAIGVHSTFLSRLGNAIGWIACTWLASRIGERLAGSRAGFLAAVIVAASAATSWVARGSGFELLAAAALLLGVEGYFCSAVAAHPGDAVKRLLAPPAFLALAVATASVSETWWMPPLSLAEPTVGRLSRVLLAVLAALVAMLPWPLWFAWRKPAAGEETRGVERRLAAVTIYIVILLALSGASAAEAALIGAAPLALVLALWLRDAPPRGIVAIAALIMLLPVLWSSVASYSEVPGGRVQSAPQHASTASCGAEALAFPGHPTAQMDPDATVPPGVVLLAAPTKFEPR